MAIERRVQTKGGRVSYRVRWRDPEGKSRNKSFPTLREARAHEASVAVDKNAGTYIDPAKMRGTFGAYADGYMAGLIQPHNTARRWESSYRLHIAPIFGHRQIGSIRKSEVQAWVKRLKETPMTTGTVRQHFGVLLTILNGAVDDLVIPRNPAVRVKMPKNDAEEVTPPSTADVWAFIESLKARRGGGRYVGLAVVLAGLGLRLGEALALTVDDIDTENRTVEVRRQMVNQGEGVAVFAPLKTKAARRTLPLPSVVADALRDHMRAYPPSAGGLLFTAANDSTRPMPASSVQEVFKRQADRLGLKLHAHILRHYYASLLIHSGASIKTVQRLLGHESSKITLDTYGHMFGDDDGPAGRSVDRLFGGREVAEVAEVAEVVELAPVAHGRRLRAV